MLNNIKNLLQKAKNWVSNLIQLSKEDVSELWNDYKILVIPLIILGVVIKFRDILISILLNSAKRLYQSTQNKSATLQNQETQANTQADNLVQQADNLSSQQQPVNSDWYKNAK